MNFKRRIAAITLAAAMAFSTMSFGASAVDKASTFNKYYDSAHNNRHEISIYRRNELVGDAYSDVKCGGFFWFTAETRVTAKGSVYADVYGAVSVKSVVKTVTEDSGSSRAKTSEWVECASGNDTYPVQYHIYISKSII